MKKLLMRPRESKPVEIDTKLFGENDDVLDTMTTVR